MISVTTKLTKYELDIRAIINLFYQNERILVNKDLKKKARAESEVHNNYYRKNKVYEQPDKWIEISQKDKDILVKLRVLADDGVGAIVTYEGKATLSEEKLENEILYAREIKNKIKLCLYSLLSEITGIKSEWGTLTGVRPSKLIFMLKKEGLSDEECIKRLQADYLCSENKARLILDIANLEYIKVKDLIDQDNYSLYIGIPFCPTTCLYCSFTSYAVAGNEYRVEKYLQALFKDIEETAKMMAGKKLVSVYVGGGTPTALNEEQLDELLTKVKTEFNIRREKSDESTFGDGRLKKCELEFTVEAGRPDSITKEKLKVIKKHGVNRISINPQIMNDEVLKLIGRRHSVSDIIEKYNMARNEGFVNINMDVIMGLPGQNLDIATDTIAKLIKLEPEEITVHTLSLKKNSALTKAIDDFEKMMDNDTGRMVNNSREMLTCEGYVPYYLYRQKNITDNMENVGYSKEGFESIYNILMMEEMQTIVACGAGTITKRVDNPRLFLEGEADRLPRITRYDSLKNLDEYIERIDDVINKKRELLWKHC